MVIVIDKANGSVVAVGNLATTDYDSAAYQVVNAPQWDWSKADLTGVDRKQPNWFSQLTWNGTTLVKK